jgi:hypothetical protein
MSPMLFMPYHHQVISKKFEPALPLPDDGPLWNSVYQAACEFWEEVFNEKRISNSFKEIAKECREKLEGLKELERLLPKKR